ncbi:DUF2057 domain-containing protein [Colwellia sp. D2M02]|uniref:DUF2057 family protein n=1 Tax=Colwellia sp. D2M02 TaxID=2841562 RepID=UPI001C0831FD|nr:DUF2057 family protein [Colwellia sp. D2M02]MBU2894112.1 DUF2057 domain-containing protein [Colwellia sp. D2M02]
MPLTVSAATLTISDNLVLKSVNDKPLDVGFFSTKSQVELTSGEQAILVKYKDVFEDLDFAEDRLVESDYFIAKFTLSQQKSLLLSTPKVKNLAAAEKFSHNPELILSDENNQTLVLELLTYDDYKLAQQVNQAVKTLAQEPVSQPVTPTANTVTTAHDTPDVAAQVATASTTNNELKRTENEVKQTFNNKVANHIETLPMLKYWWKKASDAEKQDFIRYIKTQ